MADKKVLLSSSAGAVITGTTGDTTNQQGHSLVVIASATSWGNLTRIIIECSADNGTTWVPCTNAIDGSDAIVDDDVMFQIQPLGRDVYIRARATQVIGTPTGVNVWLNEVWL